MTIRKPNRVTTPGWVSGWARCQRLRCTSHPGWVLLGLRSTSGSGNRREATAGRQKRDVL